MENPRQIGICVGIGFVFVGIVAFAFSWDSVEPTEWGLKYNSFTKSIDNNTIYDGGRYLIGPVNSFIKFPRTLQTIKLSEESDATAGPLSTRTNEGLSLKLYVTFQYKIIQADIPKIYLLTGTNYETTYLRIARETLLAIAGSYNAQAYWENRTAIGTNMLNTLNKDLQSAYATCESLQITYIDLPDVYEAAIVATQVAVQQATTKLYAQQAALIRKEIDVLRASAQQNITITNATAEAAAYSILQKAQATTSNNSIGAENSTYEYISKTLGLNSTQLDEYIFLTSLQTKDSPVFVGFENTVFTNNI